MKIFKNIEEVQIVGQLPANCLINADCLGAMKNIPDKSVDMVLCDLPYG
jgi:DNA modification methylase